MVDILLVLSHTDAAGVYLHQFCQRVHQSAPYAYGSTHGNILIGELFACYLAGAVDAGSVLADAIDFCALGQFQMINEVFCLATSCSIANGDGLNLVLLDKLSYGEHRLHTFGTRRVGEDDIVVQQVALFVQTDYFAACTESWVDTHYALLAERAGHQQLFQVADEDTDSFLVGLLT